MAVLPGAIKLLEGCEIAFVADGSFKLLYTVRQTKMAMNNEMPYTNVKNKIGWMAPIAEVEFRLIG